MGEEWSVGERLGFIALVYLVANFMSLTSYDGSSSRVSGCRGVCVEAKITPKTRVNTTMIISYIDGSSATSHSSFRVRLYTMRPIAQSIATTLKMSALGISACGSTGGAGYGLLPRSGCAVRADRIILGAKRAITSSSFRIILGGVRGLAGPSKCILPIALGKIANVSRRTIDASVGAICVQVCADILCADCAGPKG